MHKCYNYTKIKKGEPNLEKLKNCLDKWGHYKLVATVDLKEDAAVLDVACGTGELLNNLNAKCPIQGFGVDIADAMIKVASSRYSQFEFVESNCIWKEHL